jgi:hypothetical protein
LPTTGTTPNQTERSPPLKLLVRSLLVLLITSLVLVSCGYHNPYVYSGPDKSIYVTNWKNRTNILQLDSQVYQSLIRWYQKSGSLQITKKKEGADYILAGEIISYNIPSLTFGANNNTSEVKFTLTVRYVFKDLKTDKVLIEKSREVWTEAYQITPSAAETRDNADEALAIIIDELSQKIYQRSLLEIAK